MTNKIKILIVDDSRIFRGFIEEVFSTMDDIQIVGSVRNGVKAMEFIRSSHEIDMITLDVEMPEMDGLATLKAINELKTTNVRLSKIGIIMVSAVTHRGADITIKALEMGAFDFITKPSGNSKDESIACLRDQLSAKINLFNLKKNQTVRATINFPPLRRNLTTCSAAKNMYKPNSVKVILIGVSTGGPKALTAMLPELSNITDIPILIVQHMPPTFTQSLANSLNMKCDHTVTEAKHNDIVEENHAYVAPGGKHMVLRKNADGKSLIGINEQPPVVGCRPSVDVLFRSASMVFGGNTISIILTGMGTDGTKGMGSLKRAGSHTIVQDESTSVVWGMPGSAVDAGVVDEVCSLNDIPRAVGAILKINR